MFSNVGWYVASVKNTVLIQKYNTWSLQAQIYLDRSWKNFRLDNVGEETMVFWKTNICTMQSCESGGFLYDLAFIIINYFLSRMNRKEKGDVKGIEVKTGTEQWMVTASKMIMNKFHGNNNVEKASFQEIA